MMSVLVEDPEGKAILLTKGAPEEVFQHCSHFELDGKLSPMDPSLIVGLKEEYASLSSDGFRVLAVANKELTGKQICAKEDERGSGAARATSRSWTRPKTLRAALSRRFTSTAWP